MRAAISLVRRYHCGEASGSRRAGPAPVAVTNADADTSGGCDGPHLGEIGDDQAPRVARRDAVIARLHRHVKATIESDDADCRQSDAIGELSVGDRVARRDQRSYLPRGRAAHRPVGDDRYDPPVEREACQPSHYVCVPRIVRVDHDGGRSREQFGPGRRYRERGRGLALYGDPQIVEIALGLKLVLLDLHVRDWHLALVTPIDHPVVAVYPAEVPEMLATRRGLPASNRDPW